MFSREYVYCVLSFRSILLGFLLCPISFISVIVLPARGNVVSRVVDRVVPVSCLFDGSFIIGDVLFRTPSFLQ